MKYKSDFLNAIESRGFIYQSSDIENLDNLMSIKSITGYIGFDITSDSLHIGSLIQLMLLHWLDYYDHKPIALLGGGTTLIGDPSGKDISRPIISRSDINQNISKINIGAITDVSDQYINLNLKGENIYELLSAGCPYNFDNFKENKNSVVQTVLNGIDVVIYRNEKYDVNLLVRRSFSEHLWSWISDSSSRL